MPLPNLILSGEARFDPALLAASSEENQDRNEFVVDEVVLCADRDERGISRPERATISIGLEGRFAVWGAQTRSSGREAVFVDESAESICSSEAFEEVMR